MWNWRAAPPKGIEPEAVTLAAVNGRTYAFIALERIGGIMAYDITYPAEAAFVNYINTRDFNDALTGDVAPEGLAVLAREESVYLLAAFEVSGTVASYRLTDAEAPAVSAVAVTGFDLDYTVGDAFAGGTLLVIYADGSTKEVALTADMLEGFDTSSVGEKQVTVAYAGKTAQIAVTVEAAPQPEPTPEPEPEPTPEPEPVPEPSEEDGAAGAWVAFGIAAAVAVVGWVVAVVFILRRR